MYYKLSIIINYFLSTGLQILQIQYTIHKYNSQLQYSLINRNSKSFCSSINYLGKTDFFILICLRNPLTLLFIRKNMHVWNSICLVKCSTFICTSKRIYFHIKDFIFEITEFNYAFNLKSASAIRTYGLQNRKSETHKQTSV